MTDSSMIERPDSYAIIIGIDDARGPHGRLPKLPCVRKDIARVTLVLHEHGFKILATTATPEDLEDCLKLEQFVRGNDEQRLPLRARPGLAAEADEIVSKLGERIREDTDDVAIVPPPKEKKTLVKILQRAQQCLGAELVVYITGHAHPDAPIRTAAMDGATPARQSEVALVLQDGTDSMPLTDICAQLYGYSENEYPSRHAHTLVTLVTCFSGAAVSGLSNAKALRWVREPGDDPRRDKYESWTFELLVPSTAEQVTRGELDDGHDFTRRVVELLRGVVVRGGESKLPGNISIARDFALLLGAQADASPQYIRRRWAPADKSMIFSAVFKFPWRDHDRDGLLKAAQEGRIDRRHVAALESIRRYLWSPYWYPLAIKTPLREIALALLSRPPVNLPAVRPLAYELLYLLVHRFNDEPIQALDVWRAEGEAIQRREQKSTLALPAGVIAMNAPVTRAQFHCFDRGRTVTGRSDREPVTAVSFEDALGFCRWVNGRLLTDQEMVNSASLLGLDGTPPRIDGADPLDSVAFLTEWLDPEGARRRSWRETPAKALVFGRGFDEPEHVPSTRRSGLVTFRVAWDRS